MTAKHLVVCGAIGLFFLSGCTRRVYFSESIRDGFELGAGGPSQDGNDTQGELQYFAGHRIVLQREITSRRQNITRGRIVQRRGRLLEQVIIRRGTPGVAVGWGEDWVAVSFEKGTQLVFERHDPAEADGPHPPADILGTAPAQDVYHLRATPIEGGPPNVDFDAMPWELATPHRDATLQVKRNALGKKRRSRRILRGNRL